ncbi:hypothetical protein H0H93_007140, partial [Arthromyces matolae]
AEAESKPDEPLSHPVEADIAETALAEANNLSASEEVKSTTLSSAMQAQNHDQDANSKEEIVEEAFEEEPKQEAKSDTSLFEEAVQQSF